MADPYAELRGTLADVADMSRNLSAGDDPRAGEFAELLSNLQFSFGLAEDDATRLTAAFYLGMLAGEIERALGVDVRLTPTQEEIMQVIRDNGGRVDSQSQVFDLLARQGRVPSEGTTKIYLAALKSRGLLIANPGGKGYRLPGSYIPGLRPTRGLVAPMMHAR